MVPPCFAVGILKNSAGSTPAGTPAGELTWKRPERTSRLIREPKRGFPVYHPLILMHIIPVFEQLHSRRRAEPPRLPGYRPPFHPCSRGSAIRTSCSFAPADAAILGACRRLLKCCISRISEAKVPTIKSSPIVAVI